MKKAKAKHNRKPSTIFTYVCVVWIGDVTHAHGFDRLSEANRFAADIRKMDCIAAVYRKVAT